MQSLADVLRSLEPKPTHALFLAFDASPPFFDHEVLPAILNDGLTDVTILVDALALNASTIDSGSTRKAGISYRIASVRAIGGGKFHPKLVLLMHDGGAHALIGSANLTWSGWCRNVEVMDVLTFGARGNAPADSALALAAFLESLPRVLRGLDGDATVLARAQESLLASAERSPSSLDIQTQCEVLSNVSEPLLAQIERRVPPSDISQVTVVSPFYDPTNLALVELATRYPNAKLSVIKDGLRADDFDGRSFARLGKRHQLRETWFEESPRPLHAKILLFEGSDELWLVTGSANMTTPAWLHAASDRGNVELITLRRARRSRTTRRQASIALDELLDDIPTKLVQDPTSFRFAIPADQESGNRACLHILEATERELRLHVRWETPASSHVAPAVTLSLQSQDRSVRGEFIATRTGGGWSLDLTIEDEEWTALFDDEIAVVAHLVQEVGRELIEGVAWIRRPLLLGQRPSLLELRQRLRALSSGASRSPEDLLNGIAALLEAAHQQPDAFDLRPRDDSDERGTVGAGQLNDEHAASNVLRSALRPLAMPHLESEPRARGRLQRRSSSDTAYEEYDEETQEDGRAEQQRADQTERAEELARHFRELVRVAQAYTDAARPESPETEERLLYATGGLLLSGLSAASLTLRQPWIGHAEESSREELPGPTESIWKSRRDLWHLAFSIHGWESGRPAGWFPRMAASEKWPAIAQASVWQPAAMARILVDVADQVLEAGESALSADAAFVLQMLGRITLPPSEDLEQRIARVLRDEGRSLSPDQYGEMLSALRPAGIADLDGWTRLREWLPLLDVLNGERAAAEALSELPTNLRQGLSAVLRRPDARRFLAQVRQQDGGAYCLECNTALPSMMASELATGRSILKSCQGCNRFLLPIDTESALARMILAADPARSSLRGSPT